MALTAVNNYLVPSTGTTNAYPVTGTFSATPTTVDFRTVELNGQRFVPSGVFIDNSAGIADLVITIESMSGFTTVCPAGGRLQTQYPAPMDQIVNIVGNGAAVIVFVDFPVIPFQVTGASGGNSVSIADGADAALGATTDAAAASASANATLISMTKLIALLNTNLLTVATGENSVGAALPLNFESLPQTLTYAGGILQTIVVTNGVNTWTQTFTYTGADLTGISAWVMT